MFKKLIILTLPLLLFACDDNLDFPNDITPVTIDKIAPNVVYPSPSISKLGTYMGAPIGKIIEMKVKVAANREKCWGFMHEMQCLVVTFANGKVRKLTEGIGGYKHIEGKAASLLVEEIHFDMSQPQFLPTDVSSVQYRLKKIEQ